MRLVLGGSKMNAPAHCILRVYKEAHARFSHVYRACVVNTTSLSQGCVLGADPGSGKVKGNPHSKHRGGGEDPVITGAHLTGQLVVTSFQ